ncbi:hypothetical protein HDV01_006875 [Terramyces sp. JEL0728]|nr:hypothetical protein HDV01_006875 [Terramyces sp. JEL0728]
MNFLLLSIVPLTASYSLCDKTNYPYAGQSVTLTINPLPGTITFNNQSISPGVSGSITIVDGCSFQLSKDFTMNSLLTCVWVGGKINGPADGSDGIGLSSTKVTSSSGGAVFQFITSVGNYASYKDFTQFRLYHEASMNVIAIADINTGSNGHSFKLTEIVLAQTMEKSMEVKHTQHMPRFNKRRIQFLTFAAVFFARGYNGAVATEHELCSDIGVNVLKDGGSAVDSAVATCICIGTVNFYASGIGGGGFMVHRGADGETTVFDFREEAPAAATTNMFIKDPMSAQLGGLSVAVPGELRGLEQAHKKFGKLPWKRLFEPSIAIARDGFRVNKAFEAKTKSTKDEIAKDPILQKLLAPNGKLLVDGDWLKRPEYAKTLESIAEEGADVFYNGWIADELIKTVNRTGGILTLEDLRNYRAKETRPLVGSYRGLKVISAPPPASGAVLLSVLNTIENYSAFDKLDPLNTHRLVEALKHGYAERGFYGDPIDVLVVNISPFTEILQVLPNISAASKMEKNCSKRLTMYFILT